jgi:hypothetical protein
MMQIDVQTVIIIALLSFIGGMVVGMMLTRPRYSPRAKRRDDWGG